MITRAGYVVSLLVLVFGLFSGCTPTYILKCEKHPVGIGRILPTYFVDCKKIATTENMGDFFECGLDSRRYNTELVSTLKHQCTFEILK